MSGIVSGITKVFTTVGSAAARIGSAVAGVGAATFTAAAANSAAPMASGGLSGIINSFTGGGVLGSVLTGAIKQAGYGALLGGAVGAITGQGVGKGALMGGLGGAVSGGLMSAAGVNTNPVNAIAGSAGPPGSGVVSSNTPTGVTPTGVTSPGLASASGNNPSFLSRAGKFLTSETGGKMLAGIGSGLMQGMAARDQIKSRERIAQNELDYLRARDQKITDSYDVGDSAYHKPIPTDSSRPAPSEKYRRPRYRYDPDVGRVVMQS